MLIRRYEKLKHGAQRAAFVRFLLDNIRLTHEAYIPVGERLGVTIETMYILGVVVMGDIEGKPFNATKVAAYMDIPRSTVLRRLTHLEKWGLIYRTGRNYFAHDKAFNSITGLHAYRRRRKLVDTFVEELSILDKRL